MKLNEVNSINGVSWTLAKFLNFKENLPNYSQINKYFGCPEKKFFLGGGGMVGR